MAETLSKNANPWPRAVTQILVFDTSAAPRSLVDVIEYDADVCEAAQIYKRHWVGGRWSGGHDGYFVAIRRGYAGENGRIYPFGYSRLF